MKYAINVVSLLHLGGQWAKFPGCFFAPPQLLINEARWVGYDGVQMIPVRGATGNETGILLFEDAWNAVPGLIHALRHRVGEAGLPSCINDWVVSPSSSECQLVVSHLRARGVLEVVHKLRYGAQNKVIEVHPGLDMTVKDIAIGAKTQGHRLCIDTLHLTRNWRDYELQADPRRRRHNPLLRRSDTTETLAPYTDVVHLHPESVEEFIDDPEGGLHPHAEILRRIIRVRGPENLMVVAEYPPPKRALLSARSSRRLMTEMLWAMQNIVENA